jgi:hypothetical protein
VRPVRRFQKPNLGIKRIIRGQTLKLFILAFGLTVLALGQRGAPAQPESAGVTYGHKLGGVWADKDSFWAVRIGQDEYASETARLILPPHQEPMVLNLTFSLLAMAPTSDQIAAWQNPFYVTFIVSDLKGKENEFHGAFTPLDHRPPLYRFEPAGARATLQTLPSWQEILPEDWERVAQGHWTQQRTAALAAFGPVPAKIVVDPGVEILKLLCQTKDNPPVQPLGILVSNPTLERASSPFLTTESQTLTLTCPYCGHKITLKVEKNEP